MKYDLCIQRKVKSINTLIRPIVDTNENIPIWTIKLNDDETYSIHLNQKYNNINTNLDNISFSNFFDKLMSINKLKINNNNIDKIVAKKLEVGDIISLKVYPKTESVNINIGGSELKVDAFYYYEDDNLLYRAKYDKTLEKANGNYYIFKSDCGKFENKYYNVKNGIMTQITDYFDGTNNKLYIGSIEYTQNGSVILTDDYKIYIRINDSWINK
jgi:hypothetical protein